MLTLREVVEVRLAMTNDKRFLEAHVQIDKELLLCDPTADGTRKMLSMYRRQLAQMIADFLIEERPDLVSIRESVDGTVLVSFRAAIYGDNEVLPSGSAIEQMFRAAFADEDRRGEEIFEANLQKIRGERDPKR